MLILNFYANFARKRVVFWKNLHSWRKFYTTASRDSRDKSQLWVLAVKMLTIVTWSWDFEDNDDDDGVDDDGLYLDDDDDRRLSLGGGVAVPEADKVTPPCRGRHTYTLLWWEGWCHNWKIQQWPCNTLHLRRPTHLWATLTHFSEDCPNHPLL